MAGKYWIPDRASLVRNDDFLLSRVLQETLIETEFG